VKESSPLLDAETKTKIQKDSFRVKVVHFMDLEFMCSTSIIDDYSPKTL
jgi:hypothetical protein